MSNLKHKVELVEELFTLTNLTENERKRLWFVNLEDLAIEAVRLKSCSYFIAVCNIAIDKTRKFFFSLSTRLFMLRVYCVRRYLVYYKKSFSR